MSDWRQKLAAYSPHFVEALESIEQKIVARTELLAGPDVILELHKRIDQVAESTTTAVDTHDSVHVRLRSLELGAELYAQSMQEALRQRDERIEALETKLATYESGLDDVRDLVVASRSVHLMLSGDCDYIEDSHLEALAAALKHFEAVT